MSAATVSTCFLLDDKVNTALKDEYTLVCLRKSTSPKKNHAWLFAAQ